MADKPEYGCSSVEPIQEHRRTDFKKESTPHAPELNALGEHSARPVNGDNGNEAEPARSNSSFTRRLWQELKAHKPALAAFLALSFLQNLFGLAIPWITQAVLDKAVPAGNISLLNQLVLVMVVVTAFQIAITIWRRIILIRFSVALDRALLGEFCSHLLTLPTGFFKARRAGDIVARFHDGGQVRGVVAGSVTRSVIDCVMVAIYFAVMFVYSGRLAFIVSAILVLFAAYTLTIGPWVKRVQQRLLEDKAVHEAHLVELITGIDLVKALGVEGHMRQRWEKAFGRYLASDYAAQRLRQILESLSTAIKFLCTVALIWYGAVFVMNGQLSLGRLVAFSMIASEALLPLVRLIVSWGEIQESRAALDRMQEVLAQRPEPQLSAEARVYIKQIKGHVQCEEVFFQYPDRDDHPVLRGASFELKPGEHVALVGRSGSGKTTLARLLLGLYRPTRGRIRIDGWDTCQLDLETYRRQVGAVLQDNLLLAGTIEENIALGESNPDLGRLVDVASLAGADEFIDVMPQGYKTLVGDLGLTLSGGQRQRISLARALYRNPRLLIMDEATSALDGVSEHQVQEHLETILAKRTALVIAHKIGTVRRADRILVLDDGQIVEQGNHEELLQKRGVYCSLASAQLRE